MTSMSHAAADASRTKAALMDTFGASAPLEELTKKFGFTADHVVAAAKQQIAGAR